MSSLLSGFKFLLSPLHFMELLCFAWASWAIPLATSVLGYMGSKKQPQSTTATSTNEPWGPAAPYLEEFMRQAQSFGASPLPYANPSQMVAPLNPLQMQAPGLAQPGINASQQVAEAAASGIQPFLRGDFMDVGKNPYLQSAIGAAIRPVTQSLTEQVLPNIRGAFGNTDAFNQSRQGIAEGIASRGYLDTVADIAARMSNAGYNTGLQATQQSFGQVPLIQGAQTLPATQAWDIGALLQGQAQREVEAPGAFDRLQWSRIQDPFNLFSAAARGGQTTTTTSPNAVSNPLLAAAGSGLTGMQMYDIYKRNYQQPAPTNSAAAGYPSGGIYGGGNAYGGFAAPF